MRRVESLNLWREWNGILNNLDEIHQKCRQSSSHLPISIPSELLAIAVCSFWSSENCCKISLAAVILHSSSPPESADIFFNAPAHCTERSAVAKRKTHSLGKEFPRSTFISRKTIHTVLCVLQYLKIKKTWDSVVAHNNNPWHTTRWTSALIL